MAEVAHHRRSLAAVVAVAVLASPGCATRRHRYVDLTVARAAAVAAARASAATQGICPVKDDQTLAVLVKAGDHGGAPWRPAECDKLSPAEHAGGYIQFFERDPVSDKALYTSRTIELRAHERPGGTRLSLVGDPDAPLDRVLPDAPGHEYRVQRSFERQSTLVMEPATRIGVTSAGGRDFPEAEIGTLIGVRLWRHGGGELEALPEHGLSLLVSLGLVVELQRELRAMTQPEELTRRVGVALQYDRVQTVSPIPGAHLKQGPRTVVRLSVDALRGKREGVEVGLSVQPIDWIGGVYARAGYHMGEDRGMTSSAGVELGQAPITALALIPVAFGLAYLLVLGLSMRDPP